MPEQSVVYHLKEGIQIMLEIPDHQEEIMVENEQNERVTEIKERVEKINRLL
jgi:hypothetical protein